MTSDHLIFGVVTLAPPPDTRRSVFSSTGGDMYYIAVVHRDHLAIQNHERDFLVGCMSPEDAIELGEALIEEARKINGTRDLGVTRIADPRQIVKRYVQMYDDWKGDDTDETRAAIKAAFADLRSIADAADGGAKG